MEKTLTQRLNEVNVEAAELLLREIKQQIEREDGPDLYMVNGLADAISRLRVNTEPMDLTVDLMKMVFSKTLPAPGGRPDDYDAKKHSGLIEE